MKRFRLWLMKHSRRYNRHRWNSQLNRIGLAPLIQGFHVINAYDDPQPEVPISAEEAFFISAFSRSSPAKSEKYLNPFTGKRVRFYK